MRIAVLGAATAALVGATLAITPLSTVGTPTTTRPACNNGVVGPHCDRLANFLLPETQAHSEAVPAAPVAAPKVVALPATATPPGGAANVLPAPHAATAAQVVAPRVALPPAVPSAAVPGVGAPGVPGQPIGTVPGAPAVPGVAADPAAAPGGVPGIPGLTDGGFPSDLNDLLNPAYSLVNGVVAANAIGPVIGSVAGVAGVAGSVASAGLGLLTTLAVLNRGSDLTGAGKLVSMLVPTVGLPALTSVLPTVGPTGLPALPAVGLPQLPAGLPSVPGGLPSLPGGIGAVGAALPAIGGALHSLPPLPALPSVSLPQIQMPGPPKVCISTLVDPFHQC